MSAGGRVGENVVIFSGLLEIPGESAHKESRITRHEMDIVDAAASLRNRDSKKNVACSHLVLRRF